MDHHNIYQRLLDTFPINTSGRTYLTRFITDHDIGNLENLKLAITIMVSQHWTPSDLKQANNLLLAKYIKYKLIDQSLAEQLMMAGGDEVQQTPTSSMQLLVDDMWTLFAFDIERHCLKQKQDEFEKTCGKRILVLHKQFKHIPSKVGYAYIDVHKLNKSLLPGILKECMEMYNPSSNILMSHTMAHLTMQEIKADPQNIHFKMIEPHTYSLRLNQWIRTILNAAMRLVCGKEVTDISEHGLQIFFQGIRILESLQEMDLNRTSKYRSIYSSPSSSDDSDMDEPKVSIRF